MAAQLQAITWSFPDSPLTNEELARDYPDWPAEKIESKTGISRRFVAQEAECASDLACRAAQALFATKAIQASEIDFILLCTQSPDYFLPTTACLLQHRLGIPTTAGALDFNLGCSGFVYGLGLATGLIESGQAGNVLLLTAETYTKYIRQHDRNVRTIFGDGAAATLVNRVATESRQLGPFVYGTDGSGGENLIVREGGFRHPCQVGSGVAPVLFMNGPEIFSFTLRTVPGCLRELLNRRNSRRRCGPVHFHQANGYMLKAPSTKCELPTTNSSSACATAAIPYHLLYRLPWLKPPTRGGSRQGTPSLLLASA